MMNAPAGDDIIEIEMDFGPRNSAIHEVSEEISLDMTRGTGDQRCVDCSTITQLSERGRCRACALDGAQSFGAIVAESAANADTAVLGSMTTGVRRGIGFSSMDGYIQAIRNGVPAHTHASYLATLHTSYGMTSADVAALDLPGPMAVTALPSGAGIKHVPTGPSIFDLPKAQRTLKLGAAPAEVSETVRILNSKDMIAGAVAEGHGVIVGWRGEHQITRADIVRALESIGRSEWTPRATSARAQAGRAVQMVTGQGYDVRAERKGAASNLAAGVSRWTVGSVNHGGSAGSAYGKITLVVTLTDDIMTCDGDPSLGDTVRAEYSNRLGLEVYQSSDITSWLGGILTSKLDAVRFGVGWYVPARHADGAGRLCKAVADAGFGCDWILPALPVATSDQLRDGILRGLTDEIGALLARLTTERSAAKEARVSGDIGQRRAGSFLADLREIGKRTAAYGEILGPQRVSAARESVRLAIVELELLLGDDHTGISARFSAVWDEIERDRASSGGTL